MALQTALLWQQTQPEKPTKTNVCGRALTRIKARRGLGSDSKLPSAFSSVSLLSVAALASLLYIECHRLVVELS